MWPQPSAGPYMQMPSSPRMACRRTVILPGGETISGFFASNFTLAEIGTLYAKQVFPFRDHQSSHQFRCSHPLCKTQMCTSLGALSELASLKLTPTVSMTETTCLDLTCPLIELQG